MARTFGVSQAWKVVQEKLGAEGARIENPDSINKIVDDLERRQPHVEEDSKEAVRQKIIMLDQRVETLTTEIIAQRQVVEGQVTPVIEYFERTMAELQTQGNLLVRLYHRFTAVPRFKRKLVRARGVLADAAAPLLAEHDRCKEEKARMDRDFGKYVEAHVQLQKQRLQAMRVALASPELAGAKAEVEVAGWLARLPETFAVLHDVRLHLERAIQFNGNWLKTAQCDHIVVGPTGVFVIESKRWSRRFALGGEAMDPFAQVNRARFLCQCILRDRGMAVTPRDIIANAGMPLTKPPEALTRICRPESLAQAVTSRAEELSPRQAAEAVEILQGYLE